MNVAVREHTVCVGDRCVPVGALRFGQARSKQISTFRYLPEWLARQEAFALAPSLPLVPQAHHFSSRPDDTAACLPGAIADAAPDAWGRGIIARAAGHGLDELDYLLAVDDKTRQGALRFLDGDGVPLASEAPPVPRMVDMARLHRLCSNLQAGAGDLRQIARELRGASASMGGARPKAVIAGDDGTLYVAKFTSGSDTRPVERVEVATLALAREVGVRAARASLAMPESDEPVALIERFDRGPGGVGRRHYLSAQSFIGAFKGERRFYTDIADGLRSACRTGDRALAELEELHRRILFAILVSNTDDHLKNHGLLYDGAGGWTLSPAFDLNPQHFRHRQLKTGISELSGFEPSVEAWVEAAPFFEVSEDRARATAAAMAARIAGRWRGLLLENGVTEGQCSEYAAAFEHEQMSVALSMVRPKRGMDTEIRATSV